MLAKRKTKIVATIGPASESEEMLKKCIMAGMNVARLNFSHGEHAQHQKVIKNLLKLSETLKAPVALLQDLQGPKVRVGKIKDIILKDGDEVSIVGNLEASGKNTIPIDIQNLHQFIKAGDSVLIDDGLIELRAKKIQSRAHFLVPG